MVFIEESGVAYGLSYRDNGNGSSRVKLLISPLYQSKTYECDTGVNVANEFKGQLSLTLIEDSAEADKVGVVFPGEETSKEGKKYVKSLTFNIYKIKHSTNAPSVEHLGKTKLQKNANNSNPANKDNSYFQPRAMKVDDGNIIVIAHNLKDQTLVAWYLESNGSEKLKALRGKAGIIERKLFKFDNPGQLALDGNTMLYAQVRKIIKNQEVKTQIFKFDIAKVVQDLKDGKGVDDFLLGNRRGQINKASSLSRKDEISFLQHVKRTEGDSLVAFLTTGQSSNKQELHLISFVKNGPKSNFTVCEWEDPVEQLYVKNDGQDGFIVTTVSGENIITFNHTNSEKPHNVTIIPVNSIRAFSDFVNIINGRFTSSIISSSTAAPITVTETVVTSKKTPTVTITSTAGIDAVKTTKLTTEAPSPTTISTSATSKPTTTQISTVKFTTFETTATSQATTVTTTSTNASTVPSDITTSTEKPSTATISSTSVTSKPSTVESTTQTSTASTLVEPATAAETSVTSKATMITTTLTNAPIATSDNTKISTEKPTIATISSTSVTSKPSTVESTTQTSTASTLVEPATAAETITTSQMAVITTISTSVPITNSKTTQTVSTMLSTRVRELTTPMFTTTLFSQPTPLPSPHPTQLIMADEPNRAGIITGSLLGAIGVVGIIGFIAYKCIKKCHGYYNVAHTLELVDLESHSNSSNEEILFTHSRKNSSDISMQSETALNSVSVESSSRSSSPSPESSRSSESKRGSCLSWDSNDVPEYHF